MERVFNEPYALVTNTYLFGLYKTFTDWADCKEAFGGGEEAMHQAFSIAKHDRHTCCGVEFVDDRRLAEWSYIEPNRRSVPVAEAEDPGSMEGVGPPLPEPEAVVSFEHHG